MLPIYIESLCMGLVVSCWMTANTFRGLLIFIMSLLYCASNVSNHFIYKIQAVLNLMSSYASFSELMLVGSSTMSLLWLFSFIFTSWLPPCPSLCTLPFQSLFHLWFPFCSGGHLLGPSHLYIPKTSFTGVPRWKQAHCYLFWHHYIHALYHHI